MHGARSSTLLLNNVLHIPRACSNLISGTQLACHGIIATLRGTDVTLSLNIVPFVNGFVECGMYHLNVTPILSSVSTTSSLLSRVSLNPVLAPSSLNWVFTPPDGAHRRKRPPLYHPRHFF